MTTDTITLTDFLLARIAEDEARSEDPHDWYHGNSRFQAEWQAKRQIAKYLEALTFDKNRDAETLARWASVRWVAQQMARVYADHPDYREEWAL